jgi:hypothetical protein
MLRHRRLTHVPPPIVRPARHRHHRPRWGTAGHGAEPGRSCLATTLSGTADRRPNRVRGPRCALLRRAGASSPSLRRPVHWPRTRTESRASSGPEEEYNLGVTTRTSDWQSFRSKSMSVVDSKSYYLHTLYITQATLCWRCRSKA